MPYLFEVVVDFSDQAIAEIEDVWNRDGEAAAHGHMERLVDKAFEGGNFAGNEVTLRGEVE